MFILGNLLFGVAKVLDIVISFMMFAIFFRAIISWVNPDPSNIIVIFLHRLTDPVLQPIRRMIPMWRLGLDISPIIAFLFLIFTQTFLVRSLIEIAYRLNPHGM